MTLVHFGSARRVAAVCDGCGPAWADPLTRHYDTTFRDTDQARRFLADRLGWTITATQTRCPACAAREVCERIGHFWREDADPMTGLKGEALTPVRHCKRCGEQVPISEAVGADHPERVSGLLTADDQAALVNLELDIQQGEG